MKQIALTIVVLLGVCLIGCISLREFGPVRSTFYPPTFTDPIPLGTNAPGVELALPALDRLLKHYVVDGEVDYRGLATETQGMESVRKQLAATDFETLSRYAQAAFLINAYNAFTLSLLLEHPKAKSIKDIPAAKRWKAQRWNLLGRQVSLDEIEHEILRPEFADPRLHFALVCAARGCPPLRNEIYTGKNLDKQLTDQARRFFSLTENFRWDANRGWVHLSELLDWFRADFAPGQSELLEVIRPWLPDDMAQAMRESEKPPRLHWLKYDWSLNAMSETANDKP